MAIPPEARKAAKLLAHFGTTAKPEIYYKLGGKWWSGVPCILHSFEEAIEFQHSGSYGRKVVNFSIRLPGGFPLQQDQTLPTQWMVRYRGRTVRGVVHSYWAAHSGSSEMIADLQGRYGRDYT